VVAWVAERVTLGEPLKIPLNPRKVGIGWQNRLQHGEEKSKQDTSGFTTRDRCIILYTMTHHFYTLRSHAIYALTPAVTWSFHPLTYLPTPKPRQPQAQAAESGVLTLTFRKLPLISTTPWRVNPNVPYSFCTASTKIETTLLSTIVTAFYIPYCLGISIPYIHSLCVHTFTQINQSINQASNSIL